MVDSKRTRGSNVVELQAVADPRTGTAVVIGALDNLVKGAAGQAIQNLNLMLGLDEADGAPDDGGVPVSVTLPAGLPRGRHRAPGSSRRGRPDLGLLVGDPGTTVAGLFTTNRVAAAPVHAHARVDRGGPRPGRHREQRPGERRHRRARRRRCPRRRSSRRPRRSAWSRPTSSRARPASSASPCTWSRCSTACPIWRARSTPTADADFARAIMTTDTVDEVRRRADAGRVPRGRVREGGGHDRARTSATMLVLRDDRRARRAAGPARAWPTSS